MKTMSKQYVINVDVARQENAAFEARCAHLRSTGQKLLARIRRGSKYFGQGGEGRLFPVSVTPTGDYCVTNPGNQYRLRDVDLFVVFNENTDPIQITFEK